MSDEPREHWLFGEGEYLRFAFALISLVVLDTVYATITGARSPFIPVLIYLITGLDKFLGKPLSWQALFMGMFLVLTLSTRFLFDITYPKLAERFPQAKKWFD